MTKIVYSEVRMESWTVAAAKAKFSEVIDRALS
jgi:hypothetical protein